MPWREKLYQVAKWHDPRFQSDNKNDKLNDNNLVVKMNTTNACAAQDHCKLTMLKCCLVLKESKAEQWRRSTALLLLGALQFQE